MAAPRGSLSRVPRLTNDSNRRWPLHASEVRTARVVPGALNAKQTKTCERTASGQAEGEDRRRVLLAECRSGAGFGAGASMCRMVTFFKRVTDYKMKGVWVGWSVKLSQVDEGKVTNR